MEQENLDKSILDEKSQNLNMMEYQKEFKKVYLDTLSSLDTIEQRDDFNDQAMLFIKDFTLTVEFNQKYKSAKSTALHLLNNTLNNILENRASHSVELNSMVGMNQPSMILNATLKMKQFHLIKVHQLHGSSVTDEL